MNMQGYLQQTAGRLLDIMRAGAYKLTMAESCTGGLLAEVFTACPGASEVLEMSFVTYCDRAKTELVGVPPALLEKYTAVSAPVAAAMAEGALKRAKAGLALAVTGWAGPSGFCETWPVGLVYLAAALPDKTLVWRCHFPGDRQLVRQQAALTILQQGIKLIQGGENIAEK